MSNSYLVGTYLVQLLKAVLQNSKPKEKPEIISFEDILAMAKFHSLLSMTYLAFLKLEQKPSEEIMAKLEHNHELMVMKAITQDAEKEAILEALHEKEIYTLPIKGFYLQNMYPELGMREMADLDILIDPTKAKESKEVMLSLGYSVTAFDRSHHDTYQKKPFMDVELHRYLVPEDNPAYDYYCHIMEKAVYDTPYSYHLSWSDQYIYNLVHYAKHYFAGGSGIRSIMDFYVFLECHEKELDRDYIKTELTKLKLYDFSVLIEQLVRVWFKDEPTNEELMETEEYIFSCGTYGTVNNRVSSELASLYQKEGDQKKAKRKYLRTRLFPPYKMMCHSFKILRKVPILLPFCYVIRIFRGIFFRRKAIKTEMKSVDNN